MKLVLLLINNVKNSYGNLICISFKAIYYSAYEQDIKNRGLWKALLHKSLNINRICSR